MKGVVWRGPREMAVEEIPEPEAGPGAVVLRTGAAGICGSEVEGYLGRMGNRTPPLVMGHEFSGTVVAVGEGVDEAWVGRRVAVNPLISCGECRLCRSGHENICPERALIGIHRPGAFAEYVEVPAGSLHALPEGVDLRSAALAEPLANGVHAAGLGLERGPAELAVVVGAGTIGLMCLQAAVLSGIPEVWAVEPHGGRRARALELGAGRAFPPGGEAEEAVREATGGLGADVVLDAAGAGETRRAAARLVRPGGTVVLVGLHEDETALGFHDVVRRQLALQGSYAYTPRDFERALGWLVSGEAGIGELPDPLPLERGPAAFEELVRGPSDRVKVFLGGEGA
ncbi:Alcohol dehydrogenase GroES-like protein [Rubrobacter xylanophilus DSM 9941]|uniref:Alcohol dehydrogenase GroES-like protein n=1 Tax=Rubrobacter xylanophilus (strain DSM 9941 / JCM 11954 / NBRC 16129 / PRD-1) TaxID=266117 RepID=Q1ARQ8_RUBXD|nr:galactitol-1-phosphate 5-dehydrogenase [Rubrobacter xylanophilus]ABG05920.1 Alcohol dehydrogenase GroES-like protein [Rubrobacter xylanophilus DSM 9941]